MRTIFCLASLLSPRVIALLRRDVPAILILPWLLLGQLLGFIFGIWALLAEIPIILIFRKKSYAFIWLAYFVGTIAILAAIPKTLNIQDSDAIFLVKVDSNPRFRKVGGIEFDGSAYSISDNKYQFRLRCKAPYLPWLNSKDIERGSVMILRGKFKSVQKELNPFSYNSSLIRAGIQVLCKAKLISVPSNQDQSLILQIRTRIRNLIESNLGEGERSGLLLSLAFGERDAVSEPTEWGFKRTGLAHLLVLSGAQVTLAFVTIYWILRKFFIRRVLFLKITALLAALFFVLVTGIEGASVRAIIALILVVTSRVLERRSGVMQPLAVSMIVLSTIWPGVILDPGVQLTYAALFGLAIGAWSARTKLVKSVLACFFACLATGIVSLAWFGTFSIIGFILNPIFAPLVSFIGCQGAYLALMINYFEIDHSAILLNFIAELVILFRDFILYCAAFQFSSLELDGIERIAATFLGLIFLLVFARERFIAYLQENGLNPNNLNKLLAKWLDPKDPITASNSLRKFICRPSQDTRPLTIASVRTTPLKSV